MNSKGGYGKDSNGLKRDNNKWMTGCWSSWSVWIGGRMTTSNVRKVTEWGRGNFKNVNYTQPDDQMRRLEAPPTSPEKTLMAGFT